jgi:hypothetical protein
MAAASLPRSPQPKAVECVKGRRPHKGEAEPIGKIDTNELVLAELQGWLQHYPRIGDEASPALIRR